jgi:hypothetical protein
MSGNKLLMTTIAKEVPSLGLWPMPRLVKMTAQDYLRNLVSNIISKIAFIMSLPEDAPIIAAPRCFRSLLCRTCY